MNEDIKKNHKVKKKTNSTTVNFPPLFSVQRKEKNMEDLKSFMMELLNQQENQHSQDMERLKEILEKQHSQIKERLKKQH